MGEKGQNADEVGRLVEETSCMRLCFCIVRVLFMKTEEDTY